MEWKKVIVNSQNIVRETDKAVLIKLPKSKEMFWHPKKLFRVSKKGNGYWNEMSFTEEFNFTCKEYGSNYNVLSERILSANDILNIFGGEFFSEINTSNTIDIHVPEVEEVKYIEVLSELSE